MLELACRGRVDASQLEGPKFDSHMRRKLSEVLIPKFRVNYVRISFIILDPGPCTWPCHPIGVFRHFPLGNITTSLNPSLVSNMGHKSIGIKVHSY